MQQRFVWSHRPSGILFTLFLGLIAAIWVYPAQTAPQDIGDWELPLAPGTRLSTTSNNNSLVPAIAYSPDGSVLAVVYMYNVGSFKTPYVRISADDGVSWNAPTRVFPGSSVDTISVDIAVDSANKVHIVWFEQNNDSDTATLRYANNSSGSWSTQILSQITYGPNRPGMSRPRIVTSGPNNVDVVWGESYPNPQTSNLNMLHLRSVTGGSSWGAKNLVANTLFSSQNPDIARTGDGKLHLVWEETLVTGPNPDDEINYVRYAVGTVNSTTSTWTYNPVTPINLAQGQSTRAVRPAIIAENNTVHVIYTDREGGEQGQELALVSCSTNCGNFSNWAFSASNPITGGPVGANTQDPFYLIPSLALGSGCVMAYYHGTDGDPNHTTEFITGVNSCGGWSADIDRATEYDTRATYPDVASDGVWLQLVYEIRDATNGIQIYHRRRTVPDSDNRVFLPLLKR